MIQRGGCTDKVQISCKVLPPMTENTRQLESRRNHETSSVRLHVSEASFPPADVECYKDWILASASCGAQRGEMISRFTRLARIVARYPFDIYRLQNYAKYNK